MSLRRRTRCAAPCSSCKQPVPIAPGLAARTGARRRRRQRWRRIGGTTATLALLALAAVVTRRTPATAVHFSLNAPSVRTVSLVGDFTDWRTDEPTLRRNADRAVADHRSPAARAVSVRVSCGP